MTLNILNRLLSTSLALLLLCLAPHAITDELSSQTELQFITAIDEISNNRIDSAIEQFSQLTQQAPKFTLAKLIYADLLASRIGQFSTMGNNSMLNPAKLKALKAEAKSRVKYHQQKSRVNQLPKDLVQMTDQQPYAVMVDISQSRLYLFANDNGVPKLIKDYYASSGKAGADKQVSGDNKTPVGVYFVTKRIPASRLPSKYGAGAFPLNYPNSWDSQPTAARHRPVKGAFR